MVPVPVSKAERDGEQRYRPALPPAFFGFPANLLEDALVAKVDSVKVSQREHRVF